MANLRHGLGKSPGTVFGMDRYILSKIPENVDSQQEGAYYLVSSLFAFWHEGKDKAETIEGNLGQSLRAFVNQENDSGKKENLEKSIEKRLNALLNSHYDELPEYLRRIIALLKSKDIPVNGFVCSLTSYAVRM
jgi:CRISPR type I-E-associated protein CasB/Cse2